MSEPIERDKFRLDLYGVINSYTDKVSLTDLLGEIYAVLKQTEYHYCQDLMRQDREKLSNTSEVIK